MLSPNFSYLRATIGGEREPTPADHEALLILFLWYLLLVFGVLGSIHSLSLSGLGLFFLGGSLGAGLSALAVCYLRRAKRDTTLALFLGYVILVMLPAFVIAPQETQRVVLLDLYFVFLVSTPAFLSVWPWRLQAVASVLTTAAVCVLWLPHGSWVAVHSITMVSLASLLSFLVILLRSRSALRQSSVSELAGWEQYVEVCEKRFPGQIWNTIFLLTGLLLVLIFLDVALWGDMLSQPVLTKIYGLISLVFSALLLRTCRPDQFRRTIYLIGLLIAIVLSISRLGYPELRHPLASAPLIFLLAVYLRLSWSVALHIAFVWAVLLLDLAMKLLMTLVATGATSAAIGATLFTFRGEVAVLALAAGLSVWGARYSALRLARSAVKFESLTSQNYKDDEGEEVSLRQGAKVSIEPERRQRLVAGLLLFGILSCVTASQLLISLSYENWSLAVLGWTTFLAIWALIAYLERRADEADYLWIAGAVVQILLFIGPCTLLLISSAPGLLWLFWPVGLVLSIGLIPWSGKKLVPLLVIALITGVELIYQLKLDLPGAAIFTGAAIVSTLLSLQGSRRLRERCFLLETPGILNACNSREEVLLLLADVLGSLWQAPLMLVRDGGGPLLVCKGESAVRLPNNWPLKTLAQNHPPGTPGRVGVILRTTNWLPSGLAFHTRKTGIVAPTHGLLVEIQACESKNGEGAIFILVGLRLPLFSPLHTSELSATETFCELAKSRLELLNVRRDAESMADAHEKRTQEREYELSAMVHDINNTVQDLTLLCDEIIESASEQNVPAEAEQPTEITEQIQRIAEIARSVATVVSDAKRKRELESMADLEPRELVEVCEVVRDVTRFATLRAERKRISVVSPEMPAAELWVRVSVREHLETVLRNLLNNAIAYSDPGSEIKVWMECDESRVSIIVKDDGPGLSEEEKTLIFEAGYRGRRATCVPGGLGLGLAQSKRIAESSGGSIEADSEGIGSGSSFKVILPLHAAPDSRAGQPWALVVDDQPALAEFYCRLAKALKLVPEAAGSVNDALALLAERGRPEFVLTDVHLGASNGLDLVRHLRKEFGSALPILVVSGLSDDAVAQEAREAGASDFVLKPVGRRALYARIQSLMPHL